MLAVYCGNIIRKSKLCVKISVQDRLGIASLTSFHVHITTPIINLLGN